MNSDTEYFLGLVADDPEELEIGRFQDWGRLLCWSLWFPQMVTLYFDQFVPSPARGQHEAQTLLGWWNDDGTRAPFTIAVGLSGAAVLFLSLLYIGFAFFQDRLSSSNFGVLFVAALTVGLAMVLVVLVAAGRSDEDKLVVTIILFGPALFLIAVILITYAQRNLFPPLIASFLISIPYGIAAGTLFSMLDKSMARSPLVLRQAVVVGIAFFVYTFLIYALSCQIPWFSAVASLEKVTVLCPVQNVLRTVIFSSLAISLAAATGMVLGAIRMDDWVVSRVSVLQGFRPCSCWSAPRVCPISEPGLSRALQRTLFNDWNQGLGRIGEVWLWSNQRTVVIEAITYVLGCYESLKQEDTAFARIRETIDQDAQLTLRLDSLLQPDAFPPSRSVGQSLGNDGTGFRYPASIAGFYQLIECQPEQAGRQFAQGLQGDLASEYMELCSVLTGVRRQDNKYATPTLRYSPGESPNARGAVWDVVENLCRCKELTENLKDMAYVPDDIERCMGDLVDELHETSDRLNRLKEDNLLELPVLGQTLSLLVNEFENQVSHYEFDIGTRQIRHV